MQSPFVPFAVIATVLVLLLINAPAYAAGGDKASHACQTFETISDLKTRAEATGELTIFLAALKAAELSEVLTMRGPFTLFAPSDAAFAKLPPGTLEALLNDGDALRAILMYHLVAGHVSVSEAARLRSARTLYGEAVTLTVAQGTLFVDRSPVTRADLRARNGVIHVIDDVVVPTGTRTASY